MLRIGHEKRDYATQIRLRIEARLKGGGGGPRGMTEQVMIGRATESDLHVAQDAKISVPTHVYTMYQTLVCAGRLPPQIHIGSGSRRKHWGLMQTTCVCHCLEQSISLD